MEAETLRNLVREVDRGIRQDKLRSILLALYLGVAIGTCIGIVAAVLRWRTDETREEGVARLNAVEWEVE